MERFNKSGRILVEYRDEFKKHYSDSIDEALKEAINTMYTQRKIDEKVFRSIFDENLSDADFENILMSKKEFTKNNDELNHEFDKVRKLVNDYMIEVGFTEYMKTKNSLDMNKIIVMHQFDLNREYIKLSFGVSNSELIPLMKRKGFVEKFAVLRLNQVLKEIYNELRVPEDIDHGYSLVYYNKDTKSFSIDYKYYVPITLSKNDETRKKLVSEIRKLDRVVSQKFKSKLGIEYFSEENKLKNNLNINQKDLQEKESTISPVTDVLKSKKPTKPFVYTTPDTVKQEVKPVTQHQPQPQPQVNLQTPKPEVKKPSEPEKKKTVNEFDIEFDVSDKELL